MKILFLSAANSVHTVRWVNALANQGYKVVLVSKADHESKDRSISNMVEIIYLPFRGLAGYYLNAPVLRKLYHEGGFDVVNAHYASGYGTLARIAGLPNILLSVWGSDVYDFPYESRLKRRILEKNLEHAGGIASTSMGMAEQTKKFLKSRKTLWITPFGVDTHKFAPDAGESRKLSRCIASNDKGTERLQCGHRQDVCTPGHFDKREFVFGIVKTLSPKYGIGTIIRAFGVFLDGLPENERQNVELRIYGEGELKEDLTALAKELLLEDHVFFGGWIPNDQVPEVLRGMDVFVVGSERESESFGVAAVEAMACGLPVVATNVTGFREVVKDGETGFLVAVRDVEGMAEKMMALYRDAEMRKRMGESGRKRAERLYEWDECVERMGGYTGRCYRSQGA